MGVAYNTSIVRDGLVLHLDAANVKSYPGSGTTWADLSGNNADCNMVGVPTHTQNGAQSFWQFTGAGQGFESVNKPQTYKDLMILMRLESNSSILSMAFGVYDNVDVSLRFLSGSLRSVASSNTNDWQFGSTEDELFVNGNFNAGNTNVYNQWAMIRVYKESTSPFRYEVSSQFSPGGQNRPYIGKIASIMSYDRKLTNSEVRQNFEALRGRYGI